MCTQSPSRRLRKPARAIVSRDPTI
jgi:hypothetical protein